MSAKLKRKKDDDIDTETICVCNQTIDGAQMIKCGEKNCSSPWWHVDCAGITGLTKSNLRNIQCWKCACCTEQIQRGF